MPLQADDNDQALEMRKITLDFWKYVIIEILKFAGVALPMFWMQWNNGERLVDQGKKIDSVAVKADRNAVIAKEAVDKAAEKAAEKVAEEVKGEMD